MTPRLYVLALAPITVAASGLFNSDLATSQEPGPTLVIISYDDPATPEDPEPHADRWWNYDFHDDNFPLAIDWPINMVWAYRANVEAVKAYLEDLPGWDCPGLPPAESCGGTKFARFVDQDHGYSYVFDGDTGQTGPCEPADDGNGGQRMHSRVYGPDKSPYDHLISPEWGEYVFATTHYDRNHPPVPILSCGSETEAFGWSETVEERIVKAADADFLTFCADSWCYSNRADLDMENPGDFLKDGDVNKVHESDGFASMVFYKERCYEWTSNPLEPQVEVPC